MAPGLVGTESKRIRDREADARRRAEKPWRSWYKTPAWQARRDEQLAKQPLCERCLSQDRIIPATVAHHKVPHRGDRKLFFEGELASSCKPCHDGPEQSEERTGKPVPTIGLDGWPITTGQG